MKSWKGLDGLVVIRFLDLGFKFCLFGSLLSLAGSLKGSEELLFGGAGADVRQFGELGEHGEVHALQPYEHRQGEEAGACLMGARIHQLWRPWKFHIVVVCAYLLNVGLSETSRLTIRLNRAL